MKAKALCRVLAALLGAAIYSGTLTAQVPPPQPPWKCPGNIVNNGGFDSNTVFVGDGSMPASHTDNWTLAYGTPQLQSGAGCHDPDYISFWGNQFVGEAIQEPVTFLANHTYNIKFCARFHPDQGKMIPFVNIVLRGSTSSLTSPACPAASCEVITTTSNISSLTWNTYTACWTPKRNESWLTISPSNGSSANDGAQTSFGQVDDVCISEVPAPVIDGPKTTCTGPATYCVKPPAGSLAWSVTNGTFQPANSDGSCILVTWNQGNPSGSVHVTSNASGCPVTSNFNVGECIHPPCCHDVLKASLVNSELVSGGAALTFSLGGPQGTSVTATVVSASHVPVPGSCGPAGPITATVSSTQPSPPAGWSGPVVPFLNGNQAVWQAIPNNGSPLGQFTVNVQLPPTGSSSKCNDTVTICIEFEVTLAATPTSPCRTCTVVQCFTFKRCPLCQ